MDRFDKKQLIELRRLVNMFWYILMFFILLFPMIVSYHVKLSHSAGNFLKTVIFIFLVLFIGLRHEVGTDWFNYLMWYRRVTSEGLSFSLKDIIFGDSGYNLVNWISRKLNLGLYGVNTICVIIFLAGLFTFLNYLGDNRRFFTGLLISYPYLIMVVASNYIRQSVALGLVFLVYVLLLREKELTALVTLASAFLFHKTSVIGFVAFLFTNKEKILNRDFYFAINSCNSAFPVPQDYYSRIL